MKTGHLVSKIAALALLLTCFSAQALAVPTNVALGKPATTNSVYSFYGPERAVDGDLDIHWSAARGGSTSDPVWLLIDLGEDFDLDKIELYSNDSQYSEYYYIAYNVYFSTTTSFGAAAISGQTLVDNASYYFDIFDINVTARYIKFEVDGGTHWAHLNELKAWSNVDCGEEEIPEPSTLLLLGAGLTGTLFHRRKTA